MAKRSDNPDDTSYGEVPGRLIITIDGPAGSGKTTVSRLLARRLSYRYIDTGALYRAVALTAVERGVRPDDDKGLETVCRELTLRFVRSEDRLRLYANGVDVSDRIRTPEISMFASAASARPVVRSFLLDVQRAMGKDKGAVFEGRDMGTVVFPNADIKFFLNASGKTRALRRYREYGENIDQPLEEVAAEMRRRDENDTNRSLAPLKPADDAITIDSTRLSVEQVVETMVEHIRRLQDK